MNDAPIQIRNPEIARAIRELAEKKGQPITEAVGDAVHAELQRLDTAKRADVQRKLAAIDDILERYGSWPIRGPTPTDDDFYNEDGFPK